MFVRTDKARQAYAEAYENEDLEMQVNYGYEVRGGEGGGRAGRAGRGGAGSAGTGAGRAGWRVVCVEGGWQGWVSLEGGGGGLGDAGELWV